NISQELEIIVQPYPTILILDFNLDEMNKLLIYSTFLFLPVVGLNAQTVYSVKYESQADVKVFVVDYESQADLLVFKESYSSRAKGNDGNWFFVDYQSQADKSIYFVKYESQADLKVYFVQYESRAGWQNKEKIHLLY
ncbi:MAG: DUF6150 family protein, partial [Schleiferiaceae bacterium]|nr:DUF6150 family protein [Schleiferiaceae bacterium]